jgi:alpha-tubulin suppressor-like RCC1 family protein
VQSSGSLPAGLSLASGGSVTGTPTTAGASAATIQVTDADGRTAAASLTFTIGMPTSNTYAWGYNGYGQLGNGNTANQSTEVSVTGSSTYTQVSVGYSHSCGLVSGGTIQCWGANGQGELGNGTTASSNTPVTVSGISGATYVSAGFEATCAVVSGSAECWGDNSQGQLGNGTTTGSKTPVVVTGLTSGVTAISAGTGNGTTCAIVSGSAECWGYNNYGELGNGTTTSGSTTPVQVTGLTSGLTAISVGFLATCAIVSGSAKCWGYNHNGQLRNGTTTNSSTPVQVTGLTSGLTAISAGGYDSMLAK